MVAAVFLSGCEEPQPKPSAPPPPKITTAKPVVKDILEMDDFTGRFEAKEDVQVRSRVAGYLQEVHFKDGGLVQKGDLLFTIDQRPFQAEVENAESSVAVARTRLD
ncbi:MAG: biotin/lipoyl-binding protein, partial [Pseudomonadota bacterium]